MQRTESWYVIATDEQNAIDLMKSNLAWRKKALAEREVDEIIELHGREGMDDLDLYRVDQISDDNTGQWQVWHEAERLGTPV